MHRGDWVRRARPRLGAGQAWCVFGKTLCARAAPSRGRARFGISGWVHLKGGCVADWHGFWRCARCCGVGRCAVGWRCDEGSTDSRTLLKAVVTRFGAKNYWEKMMCNTHALQRPLIHQSLRQASTFCIIRLSAGGSWLGSSTRTYCTCSSNRVGRVPSAHGHPHPHAPPPASRQSRGEQEGLPAERETAARLRPRTARPS